MNEWMRTSKNEVRQRGNDRSKQSNKKVNESTTPRKFATQSKSVACEWSSLLSRSRTPNTKQQKTKKLRNRRNKAPENFCEIRVHFCACNSAYIHSSRSSGKRVSIRGRNLHTVEFLCSTSALLENKSAHQKYGDCVSEPANEWVKTEHFYRCWVAKRKKPPNQFDENIRRLWHRTHTHFLLSVVSLCVLSLLLHSVRFASLSIRFGRRKYSSFTFCSPFSLRVSAFMLIVSGSNSNSNSNSIAAY